MFWDFYNNNQEGVYCFMQFFGGCGIFKFLCNINGFGNYIFKFGKLEDSIFKYVKIYFKFDVGIQNFEFDEVFKLVGEEFDYYIKDLYNVIEKGDYFFWMMYFQIMDLKEVEIYCWNVFDIICIWLQKDYLLRFIGRLIFNCNFDNYFQDIEQVVFSFSMMVFGIGFSVDFML